MILGLNISLFLKLYSPGNGCWCLGTDLPSRPLQLILIKENIKSPQQLWNSPELSVQQDTQYTLGEQEFNRISTYIHVLTCVTILVTEVAWYCDMTGLKQQPSLAGHLMSTFKHSPFYQLGLERSSPQLLPLFYPICITSSCSVRGEGHPQKNLFSRQATEPAEENSPGFLTVAGICCTLGFLQSSQ